MQHTSERINADLEQDWKHAASDASMKTYKMRESASSMFMKNKKAAPTYSFPVNSERVFADLKHTKGKPGPDTYYQKNDPKDKMSSE